MKLVNWTAALAFAALSFATAASAADAHLSDCVKLGRQAAVALDAAQPGANTDQAKSEVLAGRSLCASQLYNQGVARYERALRLLGKA